MIKNERRNKTIIALVFGFDFLFVIISIWCMLNPDIRGAESIHDYVEDVSQVLIYLRAVIIFGIMIVFTVGLGVLYKFIAGSRLLISMYHACLVNIMLTLLMVIGSFVNRPFFGLIMVFLAVFIMYYGYFQTKIETMKEKGLVD